MINFTYLKSFDNIVLNNFMIRDKVITIKFIIIAEL